VQTAAAEMAKHKKRMALTPETSLMANSFFECFLNLHMIVQEKKECFKSADC
jgi:hypothetical protein